MQDAKNSVSDVRKNKEARFLHHIHENYVTYGAEVKGCRLAHKKRALFQKKFFVGFLGLYCWKLETRTGRSKTIIAYLQLFELHRPKN